MTTSFTSAIDTARARLLAAESEQEPGKPVRELLPADDLRAAYSVQSANIAAKIDAGARVVGRKIGLTNPAVQRYDDYYRF